jgi:hypothetical protein
MKVMIALTRSTASPLVAQTLALLSMIVPAAARFGRRLAETWRHRHDAALLAALDDRMLADIGLTRTDLHEDLGDALSEPGWRDPGTRLARQQGERRQARCGAVADLIRRHAAPSIVPGADAFMFPPRDPPARLTL